MTKMNGYVITGASRGIGEALARKVMETDGSLAHVVCVSRTASGRLEEAAAAAGARLKTFQCDIGRYEELDEWARRILAEFDPERLQSLYWVNNAGVLEPMGPIEQADPAALAEHLHINLLAPMILSGAFIRHTVEWTQVRKRLVHISSGAGKKPYYGWGAYCASKAGVDMLSRCIGVEQGTDDSAVKTVSIAPGVVDTAMQEQIRGTNEEMFRDVGRFIELKNSGALFAPEEAAARIAQVLREDRYAQGDVIDIRTYS
ncbi:(S)-benzoin forming benzil reductase [Paenibacillus ginsengihumi]|uniref:(S)-benzoin forming benzil reductase n=1 Tax=Paenibacillus ginsengihumi TaxID=431596 RepID=UPI0003736009|nr:(S)-benzoin forming benzil reductase [Paenibacillus ginsengihumi]